MLNAVKDILTKDVDVKKFLEMEIELTKVKKLLATEIKLKEFLVQEIDLKSFLSNRSSQDLDAALVDSDTARESLTLDITGVTSNPSPSIELAPETTELQPQLAVKKNLPAFDFSLIDTLKAEHKEIRFIYNCLMSLTIEKNYGKVAGQLESFNGEIRVHYQKADVSLYAYLRTYVQIKYPQREKAFAQLSLEMKNNSIEIFYIISQSPNIPLSDKTYDAFMIEFMAVGKLMNERINREQELLFKMYEQTNAVKTIS